MKKIFALLILTTFLSGCYWGSIFGADIIIRVNNNTDMKIHVVPDSRLYGEDYYEGQRQDIGSGKHSDFIIDGLDDNAKIYVDYNGMHHAYNIHADFFGYDEVEVNKSDFVHING